MKHHSETVETQKFIRGWQKTRFAARYRGNRKTQQLTMTTQMVAQVSPEKMRQLRDLTDLIVRGK